jgi:hypothetical protein
MSKIKYVGVNKKVLWQGIVFKKDEWKEYNLSVNNLPFDFEIEGEKRKVSGLDELSKIKGIGEETIDDIKKIFNSLEQLKQAIKKDKCPFRNDVCIKLKNYFIMLEKKGEKIG